MSPFYYFKNSKILLKPSARSMFVSYDPAGDVPGKTRARIASRLGNTLNKRMFSPLADLGAELLSFNKGTDSTQAEAAIRDLQESPMPGIFDVQQVYDLDENTQVIVNRYLHLKLHDKEMENLDQICTDYQIQPQAKVKPGYNKFALLPGCGEDVFTVVQNMVENDGLVAEPDFHTIRLCCELSDKDPRNACVSTWFQDAIDLLGAKEYSMGQGIKVAVMDNGVDIMHPAMASAIADSYDAIDDDSDQMPYPWDGHGTCCAGIIAAREEKSGYSGIAPFCELIPVRMAYSVQNTPFVISGNDKIARAIDRAWQLGADVISASFESGIPSEMIYESVKKATRLGRNGKGTVIVCSAGNSNSEVAYPAKHDEVIAVAATNKNGDRCTSDDWVAPMGSCFGPEITIAAPGCEIQTTDNTGTGGYNPTGNYFSNFSGTSAACPIVAGVAALILGASPELDRKQVTEILCKTASKTGCDAYDSQGHNHNLGFGLVNAHRAVEKTR